MDDPDFVVKVRRLPGYEPTIALRFEMNEGFGEMLVGSNRKASPTTAGELPEVQGPELRAGRFVHVLASGRRRQSYALSRLDDARLQRLPDADWTVLVPVTEFGIRYLDLPDLGPTQSVAAIQVSSDPTPPRASASTRPSTASPANPRASILARATSSGTPPRTPSISPMHRTGSATPAPRGASISPALRARTSGTPGAPRVGQRGALPGAPRTVTPETSRRVASPRPVPVRTLDPIDTVKAPLSMESTLGESAVNSLSADEAKRRLIEEMGKVGHLLQQLEQLEQRLDESRQRERDLLDVLSRWQERS